MIFNSEQKILLSLVDRDPVPTLLTALYLDLKRHELVASKQAKGNADRISSLLPDCSMIEIISQDLIVVRNHIVAFLDPAGDYYFDFSGGTKRMILATILICRYVRGSFFILERNGNQEILSRYTFREDFITESETIQLPGLITLDQYLTIHAGDYLPEEELKKIHFESTLRDRLQDVIKNAFQQTKNFDEFITGGQISGPSGVIPVDFLVRINNQVGVLLFPTRPEKFVKAVENLTLLSSWDYLGPHTHCFLCLPEKPLEKDFPQLMQQEKITIIPFPDLPAGILSGRDAAQLVSIIYDTMKPQHQK